MLHMKTKNMRMLRCRIMKWIMEWDWSRIYTPVLLLGFLYFSRMLTKDIQTWEQLKYWLIDSGWFICHLSPNWFFLPGFLFFLTSHHSQSLSLKHKDQLRHSISLRWGIKTYHQGTKEWNDSKWWFGAEKGNNSDD